MGIMIDCPYCEDTCEVMEMSHVFSEPVSAYWNVGNPRGPGWTRHEYGLPCGHFIDKDEWRLVLTTREAKFVLKEGEA